MKSNNLTHRLPAYVVAIVLIWACSVRPALSFYSPATGKWLSRDGIAEKGGPNLDGFAANDPVDSCDFLGLLTELWYGNHSVVPSIYHSKLWLITDEHELIDQSLFHFQRALTKTQIAPGGFIGPCGLYALTIGAGPDKSSSELTASFNRPRDVSEPLLHPSLVTEFSSPAQGLTFLARVAVRNQVMNWNFDHTVLEYKLFPQPSYTDPLEWYYFNSNSYVSGLLASFGYSAPPPGGSAPGYTKPVPGFVFTATFSSTSQLKAEWKRHFPGF